VLLHRQRLIVEVVHGVAGDVEAKRKAQRLPMPP
jgi:hypothetical protein